MRRPSPFLQRSAAVDPEPDHRELAVLKAKARIARGGEAEQGIGPVLWTMAMVAPTVTDYELSPDLASLVLRTTDDRKITLAAEQLRLACKCAHCIRARFDGRFPEHFPGIAIVDIGDLGYGLSIAFSDGHNTGIYPKPYLLELASRGPG
jgi:DUF971 family protein